MKLDEAIADVLHAELELAEELRAVGERHAVERDLYHLGETLARQCSDHVERLAPHAKRYEAKPRRAAGGGTSRALAAVRQRGAELLGGSEAAGLLLLHDLRNLYLSAQESEIAWVILVQAAHAARDRELLTTATQCRENAETRGKWLRTRIKQTAPQVLATG